MWLKYQMGDLIGHFICKLFGVKGQNKCEFSKLVVRILSSLDLDNPG